MEQSTKIMMWVVGVFMAIVICTGIMGFFTGDPSHSQPNQPVMQDSLF